MFQHGQPPVEEPGDGADDQGGNDSAFTDADNFAQEKEADHSGDARR